MSEKDKLSFAEGEEEEFHITDEDIDRELAAMEIDQSPSGDSSTDAGSEKPSIVSRFSALKQLKRKHWIMVALVLIIVLFGLLKLVGSSQPQTSFGTITPALSSQTELVAKKAETDLTKEVFKSDAPVELAPNPPLSLTPAATAPAAISAPVPAATSVVAHAQLKTDLTSIASNETKLTQALESIQQQNQALSQQVKELSSRVVGLESNLNESSQAVEGLSQQVVTMKKTGAPTPSASLLPQASQDMPSEPQYTVEAVVPQRAWLQNGDGSTMTVMVGDDLPGLGAVVSIDPYSGNVMTASGTVVKYGN